MKYVKTIKEILNSDLKTVDISNKTGLSKQFINNYKNGTSRVENMKLQNAEEIMKHFADVGVSVTEKVNRLLKGKMTSYNIAENTKLSTQFIDKFRTGTSLIENMGVDKAEKLASYYDNLKENKIRWMNKSQWNNIAGRIDNAEDAKEFLKTNIYGWSSKESALNNFKHTIMKSKKLKMAINNETAETGGNPSEYAEWLNELTTEDLADK